MFTRIILAASLFAFAAPLHAQDAPRSKTEHSEMMCRSLQNLKESYKKDNEIFAVVGLNLAIDFCDKQTQYIKELELSVAQPQPAATPTEVTQEPVKKPRYEEYGEETKAMLRKVWTHPLYEGQVPTTLQGAIASQKILLANNPYWKEATGPGLREVCAAMHSVKLSCDYNTRSAVSHFLAYYGKGLFPAEGGTNPYYTKHDPDMSDVNDGFIGQPVQNKMLSDAIRKNAKLFKDGDLKVEVLKTSWK